jgi:hypothetical protein
MPAWPADSVSNRKWALVYVVPHAGEDGSLEIVPSHTSKVPILS